MKKQTYDNLFNIYEQKLKDSIVFDTMFHVDVEYNDGEILYELISTLYAEFPDRIWTDYDQPPEYKEINLNLIWEQLSESTPSGKTKYYDKEAKSIIYKAIKDVTK